MNIQASEDMRNMEYEIVDQSLTDTSKRTSTNAPTKNKSAQPQVNFAALNNGSKQGQKESNDVAYYMMMEEETNPI